MIKSLCIILACLAGSVNASTWYSDGSPWNTQSNITLHASSGDTLVGTNGGTFSCTSNITFSIPLTLLFTNVTWLDNVVDTGNDNTRSCLWINSSGNSLYRVSGLKIDKGSRSTQYFDAGTIRITGGTAVRVDSCWFLSDKNIGIAPINVFGVCDHNVFDPHAGFIQPAKMSHDSFLGVGSYGDYSWSLSPMYGTSNFFFFEDNYVTNRSGGSGLGFDGYGGARYVIRYNILDRIIVGRHGTDTTQRERSVRAVEVYKNLFIEHNDSECGHVRGGSALFWSNLVYNASAFITVRGYRLTTRSTPWGYANGITNWDSNSPTLFDSGTATSGGLGVLIDSTKSWTVNQWKGYSLWDATQGKSSYVLTNSATAITFDTQTIADGTPITVAASDAYQLRQVIHILDSPGRGAGALMSNSPPVINGIAQYPNQALDPIYTWDNTFSGVPFPNISNSGVQGSQYPIVNGQEIQNNTFLVGYVPFTYPHPLVSAPVTQDPQITGQPQNQSVFVGQSATFTITASGTALHYQWKFNGSNVGSDANSYVRSNCQPTDNGGSVVCVVTGSGPNSPQTSITATLTVSSSVARVTNLRVGVAHIGP